MKSKHPVQTMVFEGVTSNVDSIPQLIFQRGLMLKIIANIKCLVVMPSFIEKWVLEDPASSKKTLFQASQVGEPCKKILATT